MVHEPCNIIPRKILRVSTDDSFTMEVGGLEEHGSQDVKMAEALFVAEAAGTDVQDSESLKSLPQHQKEREAF